MIKAKEIDGELWIKASDHHQAIKEVFIHTQEPAATLAVREHAPVGKVAYVLEVNLPFGIHKLYTNPPQRTWVGLDEVEIVGCTCECIDVGEFNMNCAIDFARAIEAKLKGLNT